MAQRRRPVGRPKKRKIRRTRLPHGLKIVRLGENQAVINGNIDWLVKAARAWDTVEKQANKK